MYKLSGSLIGDDRKGTIDEASKITVDDVKTKSFSLFWISNEITCLLSLWHPVYRWHDLLRGSYVERGNLL